MLLLQEGTTLSQAEQVSSSLSSFLLCAHTNLHPETPLSHDLTTSSTSARCCPQQELGRSLLSSVASVATCGVAAMLGHFLESIETRSNEHCLREYRSSLAKTPGGTERSRRCRRRWFGVSGSKSLGSSLEGLIGRQFKIDVTSANTVRNVSMPTRVP